MGKETPQRPRTCRANPPARPIAPQGTKQKKQWRTGRKLSLKNINLDVSFTFKEKFDDSQPENKPLLCDWK